MNNILNFLEYSYKIYESDNSNTTTMLNKLFISFEESFLNIENELKKSNIEGIKKIISNSLKKAIDSVQIKIKDPNLYVISDDNTKDSIDGPTLMLIPGEIIKRLTNVSNTIKNNSNIGDDNKSVINIIFNGNVEFKGIINLLSDISYKYSKHFYEKSISKIGSVESDNILASKKSASISLIEKMESDLINIINNLNVDVLKKSDNNVKSDLSNTLSKIKSKSPDDIETLDKIAHSFLNDDDKKEQIKKIIN